MTVVLKEVRDKILEDLEQMPPELQRRAQEAVHQLASSAKLPKGATKEDLDRIGGLLDKESARQMREAIEEGCERVDPDAW